MSTIGDDEPTPTVDVLIIPEGMKQWVTAPRKTPDTSDIPWDAVPVVASANPHEPPICQGEANPKPHPPVVCKPTEAGNYRCPDDDCGAIWFP